MSPSISHSNSEGQATAGGSRAAEVFNAACCYEGEAPGNPDAAPLPDANANQGGTGQANISPGSSKPVEQTEAVLRDLDQVRNVDELMWFLARHKAAFDCQTFDQLALAARLRDAVNPVESSKVSASSLGMSLRDADILLDRYKRLMERGLPFVPLASDIRAEQLHQEKPFLLRVITIVASFHDLTKQQQLVKELMREIGERVLINSEKTIDVLQGLLVLVCWYHPHIFWGQQINNLLHIAIAMCIDMGIDRTPSACEKHKLDGATTRAVNGPPSAATRVTTNEERRSLLGTFYLTSMLSSSFKKVDAMKYSPWMDECTAALAQSGEYESDLYLVQMVRIQKIIEETHTTDTTQGAPVHMYSKAFQADLARVRGQDLCQGENIFLQLEYLAAKILTLELAFGEPSDDKASQVPVKERLAALHSCTQAIKTYVEVYFSIPLVDYLTLPFSVFGQFAHTFMALLKMASLEVDGWELKTLQEQLSFTEIIEEAAQRFDQASKLAVDGLAITNDGFNKWSQKLRWMKHVYETKFVQEEPPCSAPGFGTPYKQLTQYSTPTPAMQQQPTPPDDMLSGDFFNYWDENFWNGFSGDFDLGFTEQALNHLG